jgi:hypothetical protein
VTTGRGHARNDAFLKLTLDPPLVLVGGALKDAFRTVGVPKASFGAWGWPATQGGRVSKASFRALSDPKGAFRTGNAARHAFGSGEVRP